MTGIAAHRDGQDLFIFAPDGRAFTPYEWQRLSDELSGAGGGLVMEHGDDGSVRVRICVNPTLSPEMVVAILHTYGIALATG